MRRLPLSLTIAAVVHVGLIALLATARAATHAPGRDDDAPLPLPDNVDVEVLQPAPEVVASADVAPEPVAAAAPAPRAVAPPRAPSPAPAPAPTIAAAAPAPQAIGAAAGSAASIAPGGPPASRGDGSNAPKMDLGMRNHDHDLGFHPKDDDPLVASRGAVGDPPPSGQLAPSGGGTMRSTQGGFTMNVDADGTAHMSDNRNVGVGSAIPSAKKIGKAVGGWYGNPNEVARDPEAVDINNNRAHDVDTRPDQGQTGVGVAAGHFDISDALMRRHGEDPYAAAKLKVLDATRDERAAMSAAHRKDMLKHATQIVAANLAAMWHATVDAHARRVALFEMWDECAETGDDDLIAGGQAARTMIIGWIRAHLPADGAECYTEAELAQLNAHKQSHATFSPYR